MKTITKHLIPNAGTLILVALLFLAQSVGALPGATPAGTLAPSQTLISYQGTLTDASGNPINGTVPMEFAFYDAVTGGTLLWGPESQNVGVSSGLFHVLLGSMTPIDGTSLSGDVFLEVIVDGEILVPREVLASVAYAVEASTLPAGATTRGSLAVGGGLDMQSNNVLNVANVLAADTGDDFVLDNSYRNVRLRSANSLFLFIDQDNTSSDALFKIVKDNVAMVDPVAGVFQVDETGEITAFGDLNLQAHNAENVDDILAANTGDDFVLDNSYRNIRLRSEGSLLFFLDQDDDTSDAVFQVVRDSTYMGGEVAGVFQVAEDGQITAYGNLNMNGHSAINCGALTEANLQTKEELSAGRVDRFEEGDVLCWGIDKLEKCATPNDRLVQAVADAEGRPIVMGAELVKVIGPVKRGDILVASDVPGYAMVNNDPLSGTVIAQALEDFDGEQGVIKAMIRKW